MVSNTKVTITQILSSYERASTSRDYRFLALKSKNFILLYKITNPPVRIVKCPPFISYNIVYVWSVYLKISKYKFLLTPTAITMYKVVLVR